MPIKPVDLSEGGGLDRAVGYWNTSRNLSDSDGKNRGAGGGPNGGHGGCSPNVGGRGGDDAGDKSKFSLSSFGYGLFFNWSNLALRLTSRSGCLGAF